MDCNQQDGLKKDQFPSWLSIFTCYSLFLPHNSWATAMRVATIVFTAIVVSMFFIGCSSKPTSGSLGKVQVHDEKQMEVSDAFLKWKLKTGRKFSVTSSRKRTKSSLAPQEKFPPTIEEMTVYTTWIVKDVDSVGTATIECTLDRISCHNKRPKNGFAFDTDKDLQASSDPENRLSARLNMEANKLVGLSFSLQLNAQGRVSDREAREIVSKRLGELSKSFAAPQPLWFLGDSGPHYLKGDLKLGEGWNQNSKYESNSALFSPNQMLDAVFQYSFAGTQEIDGSRIDDYSINILAQDIGREFCGSTGLSMPVRDHEETGKLRFDRTEGYLKSMSITEIEIRGFNTKSGEEHRESYTTTNSISFSPN